MLYLRKILICSLVMYCPSAYAIGFFKNENQYKGFYWFENLQTEQIRKKQEYHIPSPSKAADLIEERKKRLDDARNQMVAVGFDELAPLKVKRAAVIAYKKLEVEMWNGALSLVDASEMANFTNPEIADNLSQPTNVFGAKLQRRIEAEESAIAILQFAKEFDLILFASNTCPYSKEFEPVIKSFASQNHFQLDITSLDGDVGNIARSLGIKSVPTLIAVKKDGTQMFEVSRGMVSLAHLDASMLLALKYSEELKQNKGLLKTSKIERTR